MLDASHDESIDAYFDDSSYTSYLHPDEDEYVIASVSDSYSTINVPECALST